MHEIFTSYNQHSGKFPFKCIIALWENVLKIFSFIALIAIRVDIVSKILEQVFWYKNHNLVCRFAQASKIGTNYTNSVIFAYIIYSI